MKKTLLYLFFCMASLFPWKSIAQEPIKFCATDDYYNELIKTNPEILEMERVQNEYTLKYAEDYKQNRSAGPVYIIPVVFHILHEYGGENISDAQILDQMAILNRDYRKLNADTSIVVPSFKALVSDAEIEFRLATIDPNGNCTNGIERIFSPETNVGDNGSKINQWPRDKYLNVWVVKTITSGAAGYSQYPSAVTGGNSIYDGVMILADYIGSIGSGSIGTSRALTHEVGHYLNLAHCWGSTNQPGVACGGSDFCNDTPETKGWASCTLNGSVCNPPIIENVQNYMEYSYCSRMFTVDQAIRMRAALTSTSWPFRSNLWSAGNLAATGALANPAPTCSLVADFDGRTQFICGYTNFTFQDKSWNGTPASWSWSFPGGYPTSSTAQNPIVQYQSPGKYDVTLSVTNANGTSTLTRTNYVVVSSPWGINYAPLVESFENISVPGNDWYIDNVNGGNTWFKTTTVGKTGTASMTKTNFTGAPQGADAFITTSLNLTNVFSTTCTFQLAFALKSNPTTVKDKVVVYSSVDCGKLWTMRYTKTGSTLSTAGIVGNSPFSPNASQWALQTVPLQATSVSNRPNVRLKFEYTYDVGNNIYIDDININGTVGIDDTQLQELDLSVLPNPSTSGPLVSFSLNKAEKISIRVVDLLGQVVEEMKEQPMEAGDHQYQLNNGMSPGVYIVQLYLGDYPITQKIVIQ